MVPEKDGSPTLKLLDGMEAGLLRLRKKTKRLSSDLAKAKKRIATLEERSNKGKKRQPVTPQLEPTTKDTAAPSEAAAIKPGRVPKRRALGRGLAQIRKLPS